MVFSRVHCTFTTPDCRVCQRRTREFLNKKILAHLGAVYSKFYTLFWPKTLYLHCILQGFYHFSFFGWFFKRTYKYFCAPAPQCFAFVHPRSRRKVPYSAVWSDTTNFHTKGLRSERRLSRSATVKEPMCLSSFRVLLTALPTLAKLVGDVIFRFYVGKPTVHRTLLVSNLCLANRIFMRFQRDSVLLCTKQGPVVRSPFSLNGG